MLRAGRGLLLQHTPNAVPPAPGIHIPETYPAHGTRTGKHTQYESDMKKLIVILSSALLLAAFAAQAQQPYPGASAPETGTNGTLTKEQLMKIAIGLSEENVAAGGGPFGAVIARDGRIIATGVNRVTPDCDPTAHAEVSAIRAAAKKLGTFDLSGCEIYTSCEPCPMCLGAIYWARLDRMYYGNNKHDAAKIGFDDAFIYEELALKPADRKLKSAVLLPEEAIAAFEAWETKSDKVEY